MSVCYCSIKKSIKRGLWQIKNESTHELFQMHGAQELLNEAVVALGEDPDDCYMTYEFTYSFENLDDDFCLKVKEIGMEVFDFQVVRNKVGVYQKGVWLPSILFGKPPLQFGEVGDELKVQIRKSGYDRPVFVSERS